MVAVRWIHSPLQTLDPSLRCVPYLALRWGALLEPSCCLLPKESWKNRSDRNEWSYSACTHREFIFSPRKHWWIISRSHCPWKLQAQNSYEALVGGRFSPQNQLPVSTPIERLCSTTGNIPKMYVVPVTSPYLQSRSRWSLQLEQDRCVLDIEQDGLIIDDLLATSDHIVPNLTAFLCL